MPTYEYECQECAHRFEVLQSMKDTPLSRCPKCKGRVKRLLGAGGGFIFKGPGFYATDYRKKEEKKEPPDKCIGCPDSTCPSKDKDERHK